jgi:hypothetical protein
MDLNRRQSASTANSSSNSGAQSSEAGGPSAGDAPISLSTLFPGHVDWSTYPFVEFRDSSLGQDDLTFLTAKGCLSIPETQALHEFVRNYFLYVHPGFPVLNEAEFWVSYTRSRVGHDMIPLLILQAVLFASSPVSSFELAIDLVNPDSMSPSPQSKPVDSAQRPKRGTLSISEPRYASHYVQRRRIYLTVLSFFSMSTARSARLHRPKAPFFSVTMPPLQSRRLVLTGLRAQSRAP